MLNNLPHYWLGSGAKGKNNNFNWITKHGGDFSAADRKDFPVTLKDTRMDYDLTVDKNYVKTGQ